VTPVLVVAGAVLAAGLAGACSAVLIARRKWLLVTVEGLSMEPAMRDCDRVLAWRTAAARVRRGDVVVLGGSLADCRLKRVAAVAGDPVPFGFPALERSGMLKVPVGAIVLVGDNAAQSYDSRQAGFFRADQIVAVVRRPLPRGSVRRIR